ncbi:TPA: lipid A deacylase LpxR family protein [Vibrio vulnificus]|uniref:lipid A deacylase LpxR family protein n=1 Tax=Vibrio vulnificus TaxID=672 RepID=UPI0005F1CE77|nr:lipid A deacylase LpxR family protein [Vibrio vulnificus]EHD1696454.1 lipid A deacylase LpxR family protein [Vibrio vulnificus]EHU4975433.1 lipid A deacylase LpxR family protein [Vibrio vulnificus]EHZ2752869.1 lipid A deacylase LpxR family protein [Vibrio vulnificus]EKD8803509.1 lipid A deacylase LpxR family protein [Vibrio vulnificus]MCU8445492.1 lipid A deacylase LpxR family protein [Vibrio vulnificus]
MKLSKSLFLLLLSPMAFASVKSTTSFSLDNDGIFGVDQDYTNGIFFAYASPALSSEHQIHRLSLADKQGGSIDKWAFSIGHKMWTPSDISQTTPTPNDRPYAGYFHAELNYLSLHPQQAVRYNLTLGTTGENALSEKAQKLVHSITGSTDPNGWEYQVDDYVAGSVGYQRHDLLMRSANLTESNWEMSHIFEANAGNFRTDVASGVMFRYGSDLANTLGAASISTENPFHASMMGNSPYGWFVYTGLSTRYRFNDLTLEGERSGLPEPSDQYDVTMQHWQSTAVAGVALYNRRVGLSFALSAKTPEYKEAPERIYGNGALSLYAFF